MSPRRLPQTSQVPLEREPEVQLLFPGYAPVPPPWPAFTSVAFSVQLAEQAFIEELARLVDHLTERLSGAEDGKPKVFRDSAVIMGSLLLIIVLAIAFNQFLVFQEVPAKAAEWVGAHVDSKLEFLILVNLFLLALGCMMDIMSAILIVAPLLTPIAMSYGIHPVHFGIIFIVNLELGYLTPPMGINLFVASAVFDRPLVQVMKSVLPFLLLMLFALAIISWFPQLSLAFLESGNEAIDGAIGAAP